jgi:hypothetical protein
MKYLRNGNLISRLTRLTFVSLFLIVAPSHAQSQRKSPLSPPSSSTSQAKEDPLAPLLRQAPGQIGTAQARFLVCSRDLLR